MECYRSLAEHGSNSKCAVRSFVGSVPANPGAVCEGRSGRRRAAFRPARLPGVLAVALIVLLVPLLSAEARAEFFNGDRLVDRYQVAIVFSRIVFHSRQFWEGLSWRDKSFDDVPAVYARPVGTVTSLGLIPAFEGRFHGKRFVKRYELGRWVLRLLKKLRVEGSTQEPQLTPVDVPFSHRDRDPAIQMLWRRIMFPKSARYRGNHYVTRYEFATICAGLARHFGMRPFRDVELHLQDVPADHWAAQAVRYCCATGILNTRGVGMKAIHVEQEPYKSEHIGRVRRRRRDAVLGAFRTEFERGYPSTTISGGRRIDGEGGYLDAVQSSGDTGDGKGSGR